MPTLLLPIAQSSASSDAWTGSGRVSSFVRSHVFCLLLHGVETNTRGTVSTNYCRAGFDANITRLENSFPFHFGWLARYCIRRVAVAVRQVCAHSTFSPQEPNRPRMLWRHILLHACNVGRHLPASVVLSSCKLPGLYVISPD